MRMKLHWVRHDKELVGNLFGYGHHNKMMYEFSERHFDYDDNAEIALHIFPADHFKPIPGKFNILFSMWEFLDLPQSYIDNLDKADMIIVPCSFCKDLFSRYTNKPIHVCWEGVDPKLYTFKQRQYVRGQKFRFLWVGAPNARKGYPLILQAVKVFERIPNVEIYIKTTTKTFDREKSIPALWKARRELRKTESGHDFLKRGLKRSRLEKHELVNSNGVWRLGDNQNIIFDTRRLPIDQLVDLYHSAHCFVLPSFGEGWGLTLCEAMATGAPCISVDYTGCADFFNDDVGYTLRYSEHNQELANYNLVTRGYVPDTHDMVNKMLHVTKNYNEALKKGMRASHKIRSKFTWENAAARLYDIVFKANRMRKAA
jgi:glycosyltransferase involved in cell wall biosynthesis